MALVALEPGAGTDFPDFPISWQPLSAQTSPAEAEVPDAALIRPDRSKNRPIEGHVRMLDADTAFAHSIHIVEGKITTAFVEHADIEPEAGTAWMDGDVLNIRACTQAPIMDGDDTTAIFPLFPTASAS